MMKKFMSAINIIRKSFQNINQALKKETYKPFYRIISIEQDETDSYFVTIQVIGKARTFTSRPEELLKDENIVNLFSPKDVRNLTYLGYLGVNTPQYKILAQKLSEETDQTVFAILKKGEETHQVITAAEILSNKEILGGLSQNDAHRVGFIAGVEQISAEEKWKMLCK